MRNRWARMLVFALAGLGPFAEVAWSFECTDVESLDVGGRSMSQVPVREQGQSASCFAHAVAGLIDAYRFGAMTGESSDVITSPIAIYELYKGRGSPEMSYLYVKGDYNSEGKQHVCNENMAFGPNARDSDAEGSFLYDVAAAWSACWQKEQEAGDDSDKRLAARLEFRKLVFRKMRQNGVKHDPNTVVGLNNALLEIADTPYTSDATTYRFITEKICRSSNYYLTLPDMQDDRFKGLASIDELHELIDAVVRDRGQPLGMGVCSYPLLKGKNPSGDDCGAHALLVIGRRKETAPDGTERCLVQLRNSWGMSCDYSDKIKKNHWCAGDGNVWVEDKDLAKTALGWEYLGPPR